MAKAEALKVPDEEDAFAPMTERERLEAIDKVKAKLAAIVETSNDSTALDARVRLLRLWQELISTRATDYVEPEPSTEAPEMADPPAETVLVEPEEAPEQPIEPADHPHEGAVIIEAHRTAPHSIVLDHELDTPKASTEEILEPYGPFLPKPAPHLNDRIRLRLIKEGVLMNRKLSPGTIVLVYPLDGEHLIEQGIAEILPAHADDADPAVEMLEF